MSKKSLLYIVGGAFMMLAAVLSLYGAAIVQFSRLIEMRGLLKVLLDRNYVRPYMNNFDTATWLQFVVMLGVGLALIAKAFVPDMIPNIAFVGAFGLLTLFALMDTIQIYRNFTRYGYYYYVWLEIIFSLVVTLGYASMTAILFMKDSMAQFFYLPAFFILTDATTWFFTRWFGLFEITFGLNLLVYLFDIVLVIAFFAIGMANKEE